jgi:hypothetical protein
VTPDIQERLDDLPEGYSVVRYRGQKWGLSKALLNRGRSTKLYAEELGGSDFVSCNVYRTSQGVHLKPCEMSAEKVFDFLAGLERG